MRDADTGGMRGRGMRERGMRERGMRNQWMREGDAPAPAGAVLERKARRGRPRRGLGRPPTRAPS